MRSGDSLTAPLARIIHDGSSRNRRVAMRRTHCLCDPLQDTSNGSPGNGYPHAESRRAEAYLKQYVEATRGEPAQLTDF